MRRAVPTPATTNQCEPWLRDGALCLIIYSGPNLPPGPPNGNRRGRPGCGERPAQPLRLCLCQRRGCGQGPKRFKLPSAFSSPLSPRGGLGRCGSGLPGTPGSVPRPQAAAVPFAQGVRAPGSAAKGQEGCLQLPDGVSSPRCPLPAALHPTTPLAAWSPVPSLSFLHLRGAVGKMEPGAWLQRSIHPFLPSESQTTSTSGPGTFAGGHILGRRKRVSCQLGGWGGEVFLSFLENLGITCKLPVWEVRSGSATGLDLVLRTYPSCGSLHWHRPAPATFLCSDLSPRCPGGYPPFAVGLGSNGKATMPNYRLPPGRLCSLMKGLHSISTCVLPCVVLSGI